MNSRSTLTLPWRDRPLAELVRLAWPISVSLLSFSVMTAVDTLFIGHLGGAALAGVALGGTLTFTLLCFGMGMLRATHITVAQAVGAGQHHRVRAYLGAALTLALGFGLATAILGHIGARFLPLLTASAASGAYAASYASVRVLGAPLQLAVVALSGARYGVGDARSPMVAVLTANASNVALVALFSLGWGGGVVAVAWATVLAQVVEVLILAKQQRAEGFGLRTVTRDDVRALMRMGVPLGVERFFDVGSFSLMIAIFARMGDLELAAHQVTHQAMMFAIMPAVAIGDATSVLVGQAVGAASLRTVPRVQRAALAAGCAYVALCSVVFSTFGPELASQFSTDPNVITRAERLFHVGAVFVWVMPFYVVGQSSLRAIGDVRAAAVITVVAAWGCTPLLAAWFGIGLGLGARGGYIGMAVELALAGALFWWRLLGGGGAWAKNARRFRATLRIARDRISVPVEA